MIFPKELNIVHKLVEIDDAEDVDILSHLESSLKFIEDNIKFTNVFVHCVVGRSRSASIVIAYVMQLHKWSFERSFAFCSSKRN